jgi:isoquinoline 1-oxidoreductase alpha subunit
MIELSVNGKKHRVEVEADTPLLWVLRDELRLTGTKFGCGMNLCGACMVHLDGSPVRTCTLPVSAASGRAVTTIEGISTAASRAVQQAWEEEEVPQCGYCQSGMIMAVTALLAGNPHPSDADIDNGITNLCRCGTYNRIRRAVKRAAKLLRA